MFTIAAPTLSIHERDARFPVRRVWCVGRNYRKHALEMGGDPDRQPPFFFSKPADAAVDASPSRELVLPYPPQTEDLHHEVELCVAIGRSARNLAAEDALDVIYGFAVGIDLTRRDLQARAKKAGRPWALAKGFDLSAPIGTIVPTSSLPTGRIWLSVDGETRQDAGLAEMIWRVPEILAHLSRSVALAPGDLILTGTPAGVGPLQRGQRVTAGIDGLPDLAFDLEAP